MRHRSRVATSVSRALTTLAGGVAVAHPAFGGTPAPDDAALEEVVVTGIKASLAASMEMKRDAVGIVDAISAEDIGKFPDTNLGEALQRVPGMSIDRRNGEGATVTARGFGPQFNLVTLNGRQMPTADAFGSGDSSSGGVSGSSRSFNFANLSADGVRALEVYKTARADMSTGGIGSTINARTYRPFDHDGTVATFGARALYDSSVQSASKMTPELSALFSHASDDRHWGVSLATNYQQRNDAAAGVTLSGWNLQAWNGGPEDLALNPLAYPHVNNNGTPADPADDFFDATFVNPPARGQLYGIPNDIRYSFAERSSRRVNGQLTLQYSPADTWTFTADYILADQKLAEDRAEQTEWLALNGFTRVEFDAARDVATPVFLEEDTGGNKDFAFGQTHREQRNELNSAGLNVEWHASERLRFSLDFHDSLAESRPDDSLTGGGETMFAFAGRVPTIGSCRPPSSCTNFWVQTFDFRGGIPLATRVIFPTSDDAFNRPDGNADFGFEASTLGTQVMNIVYTGQRTEIRQGRLDGSLEFEHGKLGFGVETRAMSSHFRQSRADMTLGDWSTNDLGQVPGMLGELQSFSVARAFSDFSLAGVPSGSWKGNADALGEWAIEPVSERGGGYGDWQQPTVVDGQMRRNTVFGRDTQVNEDTSAAYLQIATHGNLFGHASHLTAGVRYEVTDVSAGANFQVPDEFIWASGGGFNVHTSPQQQWIRDSSDYDYYLPNVDFDVAMTDTLKARVSYGSTIARAAYASLTPRVSLNPPAGSTLNDRHATGSGANPRLLPLHSDNLDLSLEWYFAENGYLSATWWDKRVTNFNASAISEESLYGIRDQTAGPRARTALAELQRRGVPSTDGALFTMMAMTEHPEGTTNAGTFYAGGAANYDGSDPQRIAFEKAFDILPTPDDPAMVFNVSRPDNSRAANVHGWELAGQYFFGASGVGILANYTIVDGDVHFDNLADPSIRQFALFGLSDSSNLVLVYEKYRLTARLAWNWRDSFLQNVDDLNNPVYVDPYQQIDLSLAYRFTENVSVSFDAINLSGENVRVHGRSEREILFLEDDGARYSLAVHYKL